MSSLQIINLRYADVRVGDVIMDDRKGNLFGRRVEKIDARASFHTERDLVNLTLHGSAGLLAAPYARITVGRVGSC